MVWEETIEARIIIYSLNNNGRKYTFEVRDGKLQRAECDILTTSPTISNLATCIEAIENES